MVNKRLQKFSCRLAVQDQVSWMAFSPGDKRNTAKVARTSIAASSVKPLRGARHQRFGTGTRRSPQVPEQVLVPATVPSQTHTDSSTLYHSDRTPRYSKRWDVERARSESAEARSQTCGRERLLLAKTSLSALSKRPGPTIDTVMTPGFSYVGLLGTQLRLDPVAEQGS
jgi:hypothetical protein